MVAKKINQIVNEMYLNGLNDEFYVMEATEKTLGGTCFKSNTNEDKYDHIDFWWDSPKKGLIGIDVKGRRKNKRNDKDYDDTINWIEILNVKGDLGWIYGKSYYIAFRTNNKIIFVKREKLQQFTEEKIKGKDLVYETPSEFYIPYQRKKYGRKDMMIKVPTEDLINISDFIIEN